MSSTHLRNSSSISSSSFDLKSANSSDDEFTRFIQAEVKRLKAIPKPIYQLVTEKFGQEITLENHVLKCPIGANYFYAFLQGEFNAENLEAYYEAKAVQDFLLVFVEKRKEMLGIELIEKEAKGESIDLEELRPKFLQHGPILYQYATDSIEKGQKFVSDYIVTGAPKQVNLPSKIKISLEESFQAIFDMYSKFAEKYKQMADAEPVEKAQKCDFLLVVTQLQSALETTMKELMVNLYDPYSRFTNSDYFYEIAAIIGSEEAKANYEKLKEKIITATLAQGAALNEQFPTAGLTSRHPVTVAYERLSEMLSFIEKNKSSMFNAADSTLFDINYDFLQNKESCKWNTIVENSAEFIKVDLNALKTEEDKIAFFTNVYNFMLIHAAVISNGLPRTSANRTNFFGKTRYNIGGHLFSLYDIHQGILRGNAKHWFYGKPFGKNDPRVQYTVKLPLPNLCFALVDLTQHSPVARPIQNNNVAEQFNQLTAEYVKRYVRFDEKSVKIPAYMKEHSSEYVTPSCKISAAIHPLQPIIEYLKTNSLGVAKECWDKVLETKKPVVVNPDRFDSFACLLEQEQLPQEYCEKYDKVCCKKKQDVAGAVEKQVQQEGTPQLIKNSKKFSFSLFKRFGKKPKKIVKQEKTCKVM